MALLKSLSTMFAAVQQTKIKRDTDAEARLAAIINEMATAEHEGRDVDLDPLDIVQACDESDPPLNLQQLHDKVAERIEVIEAAERLKNEPAVKAALAAAEQALADHNAETDRILKQRNARKEQLAAVIPSAIAAVVAVENDRATLQRLNKLPPAMLQRERELGQQAVDIATKIRQVERKLSDNVPGESGAYQFPNEFPAATIAYCRHTLANPGGRSQEELAGLSRQVAYLETQLVEPRRQLSELQKQYAKVNAEAREISLLRYKV
jgi:hypothetical protein